MSDYPKTEINRVVRIPNRGQYDHATVHGIIDEALICHVAFVQDGRPFVIPTLHARDGDAILLHGATTSRLMKHVAAGNEVSIACTLVDGLVLARAVFHHSANYRSVVLFGHGELLPDEEKMNALALFTEKLIPARWDDARLPNDKELKATAVVRIPISLASAKVRVGPPSDDAEDMSLSVWAGVLPIRQAFQQPIPDPQLIDGVPAPGYVFDHINRQNS